MLLHHDKKKLGCGVWFSLSLRGYFVLLVTKAK